LFFNDFWNQGKKETVMKGIFVIALALCISACASQPEKSVASDQAMKASYWSGMAEKSKADEPYEIVYLDDSSRVLSKVIHPKRPVVILGRDN
jgi:hypothetical protein